MFVGKWLEWNEMFATLVGEIGQITKKSHILTIDNVVMPLHGVYIGAVIPFCREISFKFTLRNHFHKVLVPTV